jgi:myo-inositol-1(or 4)-monophosphatase
MLTVNDHDLAVVAAEAGAAVVRERFGATHTRFDKGGGDFATEVDLAAEKAILEVLRHARPDDAVRGEESGLTGTGRRIWLVDPLCGTLNYATGTMAVAVNVALSDGDDVTVAAVADPFTGEVFRAGPDGAYDNSGRRLQPSPEPALVDVNLDPPFGGPPPHPVTSLLSDPRFQERFRPRVLSTTLALTWVAAGRRAAYVTEGHHLKDSVHFTAGIALCEAAGCVVTGIDGQPLYTGAGGLIAAADQATHRALLEILTR